MEPLDLTDTSITAFLLWLLVILPVAAWHTKQHFDLGLPYGPKPRMFFYTIFCLAITLSLGLNAALAAGVELFPERIPRPQFLLLGGLVAVAKVIFADWSWNRSTEAQLARLRRLLPETKPQFAAWVVVSVLAGVGEEAAYRGVLFALGWKLTGMLWAAALLSAVAFAVAHLAQGWRSVAVVFVYGLLYQLLVALTGDLYVAIGVHITYDLLLGVLAMTHFAPRDLLAKAKDSQVSF